MQILKDIVKSKGFKVAAPVTIAVVLGGLYANRTRCERQGSAIKQSQLNQLTEIEQNKFLTQSAAELRWIQVKQGSIKYNVDLLLKKGDEFSGLMTCKVKLNHKYHDLFFDYRGKEILSLFVNNQQIEQFNWNGLFLRIPKELLNINDLENNIVVQYRTKYAQDGCGLHSYVDADGKQYLYSQGESYFCNRFFPCMDQPDLKATLTFTVVSPQEWVVISNENYKSKEDYNLNQVKDALHYIPGQLVTSQYQNINNSNFWQFNETKLLPTYLFCIISGEYWSVADENPYNNITQTIYCRESLKESMQNFKDFIFQVTRESMKFYEQFFGVPYQFTKYDSIFVPEYNWGAMENPGCVTFNDIYIFREKKPATAYTQFANTMAHEMAHHWFGDYVTMKWWNDLWLNESYADFISHYCLEQITNKINTIPLTNIPVMFNMRKGWGYREDQMCTTHPIAGAIHNTEEAENIFDGITYSKGAATMKQLLCIMGAENFGSACGTYFQKFGWKNARLEDLIACLDEKFKKSKFTLKDFQQKWIEKAGMNEIEAQWDPTDRSENAVLTIYQRPALPEYATLRMHSIKIAFFKENGEIVAQDVLVEPSEETLVKYNGKNGYKALLLNYEDQSFVKVLVDENSLQFFQQHLHTVKDILTRSLIYRALFDTVRDGKIDSEKYVDVILSMLQREESDEIVNTQLLYLQSAVSVMTPRKFRGILSKTVFTYLVMELKKKDQHSQNRIILYRNNLFAFSHDKQSIEVLLGWWKNRDQSDLKEVELTLDSKWSIVKLVHGCKSFDENHQLRNELLQEQLEADKSDNATKAKLRCYSLQCNKDQRKQLWDTYIDPNNKESAKMQAESMTGFNNNRRFEDLIEYHDKFFTVILTIFQQRSTDFAKTFFECLFPCTDDLASLLNQIQQTLQVIPQNQVTLKNLLLKKLDDVKRQLRQFECFCNNAQAATQSQTQNQQQLIQQEEN